MEILSSRSPLLQCLDLSFCLSKKSAPLGQSFCLRLEKFTNLAKLTLSFEPVNDQCLDLFSSLGHTCPLLIALHLGKVPFETAQVLALVLGGKQAILPEDFSIDAQQLTDIQFSPESITPICYSLKYFRYDCDVEKSVCQYPPVALFLRHFRNLLRFDRPVCKHRNPAEDDMKNAVVPTIKHWYEEKRLGENSCLQGINIITKTCEELGFIQWTTDAPFTGAV